MLSTKDGRRAYKRVFTGGGGGHISESLSAV